MVPRPYELISKIKTPGTKYTSSGVGHGEIAVIEDSVRDDLPLEEPPNVLFALAETRMHRASRYPRCKIRKSLSLPADCLLRVGRSGRAE